MGEASIWEGFRTEDYKLLENKNIKDIIMFSIGDEFQKFCNFYIESNFFPKIGWGCGILRTSFLINSLLATFAEIKYKYEEYSYAFIRRISEMDENIKNKFIDGVIELLLKYDNDDVTHIRLKYDIEVYEGRL
jgi:hypothetical protein